MKKRVISLLLSLVLTLPILYAEVLAAGDNVIHPAPTPVTVTISGEEDSGHTFPLYVNINFPIPQSIQTLAKNTAYKVGYAIEYRINDEPWQFHNADWEKRVDLLFVNRAESSSFHSSDISGLTQATIGLGFTDFYKEKALAAEHEQCMQAFIQANDDEGFGAYIYRVDPFGFYKDWTYTFRVRFYSYRINESTKYPIMQLSPYSKEVTVTGLGTFSSEQGSSTPEGFWSRASAWAEPELLAAGKRKLIPPRLYGGDFTTPVTRGEFAEICLLAHDNITGATPSNYIYDGTSQPFSDVIPGETEGCYAIYAVADMGIVNGVGGGKFAPNAPLTRQEMATMLLRCVKLGVAEREAPHPESFEVQNPPIFSDSASIAPWAAEGVNYFASKEIIKGANGAFLPLDICSKEAALLLANRIYDIYSVYGDHFVEYRW